MQDGDPPLVETAPPAATSPAPLEVLPTAIRGLLGAPPSPAATPAVALVPRPSAKPGWKIVFEDEFEGDSLDTGKWNTELRWGPVNPPELQYYSPDALTVKDGSLRLTAKREKLNGQPYTSGVVSSYGHFRFQYGYLEARIKIPSGKGLWPAVWLLTDSPDSFEEIDVVEFRGHEPQRAHMVLHYDGASGGDELVDGGWTSPDLARGFHLYGVEWSKSAVVWYVDGIERFRVVDNVPRQPMHVIANLALGGWATDPDNSTPLPAQLEIDYIRVYQPQ